MSLQELVRVFQNVYAALIPGGLWLFDVNMEEGYRTRWRGSFAIVEDDNVCVVRGGYDADTKIGRNDITMFRRHEGHWRRSDLTLVQRCHAEDEIRSALAQAGFRDVTAFDAADDLGITGNVGRTFFRARRP